MRRTCYWRRNRTGLVNRPRSAEMLLADMGLQKDSATFVRSCIRSHTNKASSDVHFSLHLSHLQSTISARGVPEVGGAIGVDDADGVGSLALGTCIGLVTVPSARETLAAAAGVEGVGCC
jgi:hypothetical protein